MKKERLNTIESCFASIQKAHDILDDVRNEEEEAYDNMPEGLQLSERGDMMQEVIDELDEAVNYLDDAISYLDNVVDSANEDSVMEIDPWQNLKVGDSVIHNSFGTGIITNIEGKYFFIQFKEKTSKFIFPDAIDKGFITL